MPPVVPPFLIGLITASLVKRLGKPVMRGIVKTSVGLGIEIKRAAHETSEGIQDLAAEATAEWPAARMTQGAGHDHAAQAGSESKAVGKARGAGSAAAKVSSAR